MPKLNVKLFAIKFCGLYICIMKYLFSISFIVILLAQALHLTLPYAFNGIAKDFIIDNFCVNKAEVELMCSGKCYINSLLEQESEKEESKNIPFSIEKISLSPVEIAVSLVKSFSISNAVVGILPIYAFNYHFDLISTNLKPPIVS